MNEILGILFLTIVVPIWLVSHYFTKWKLAKGLSREEEKLLEDLWNSMQRMEGRISSLETILDERFEGWRHKT